MKFPDESQWTRQRCRQMGIDVRCLFEQQMRVFPQRACEFAVCYGFGTRMAKRLQNTSRELINSAELMRIHIVPETNECKYVIP